MIANLAESADLVIFAAAPLLATADTLALARQVEGCLLVVRAGKTRRDDAVRAKALLEQAGARLLGVVLADA